MAEVDFNARMAAIEAKAKARRSAALQADQVREAEAVQGREDMRHALRDSMPEVAAAVDECRAAFGEVRVLMAEENGKRVESRLFRQRGW